MNPCRTLGCKKHEGHRGACTVDEFQCDFTQEDIDRAYGAGVKEGYSRGSYDTHQKYVGTD
jgi:hypothetical protein